MFGFAIGIKNKKVSGGGGDTTAPTLSNLAVTYTGASDTSFHITGDSDESSGNAYILFVTKGAGATAAATVKATADKTQAISSGSFDATCSRSAPNLMGVQDADVVIEDASGNLSSVTRLTIYNYSAQTYFTAASIVSSSEKGWLNTFILRLKGVGTTNSSDLWQYRLQIIHSNLVSLSSSMVNLANPGTLNATAVGAPAHSSAGIVFTGSEYLQMAVIPNTHFTDDKVTAGGYMVNNVASNLQDLLTCQVDLATQMTILPRNASDALFVRIWNSSTGSVNHTNTNSSGLLTITKRADNDEQAWRFTTSLGTDVTFSGGTRPNIQLYGSARNNAGTADHKMVNTGLMWFSFTQGFTTNMNTDWSSAVQELQTNYSRAV